MGIGLFVKIVRGCLAIVDSEYSPVASDLFLIELLELCGLFRLGMLLERVLAWI